jgi:hypothetical protein
MTNPPPIGPMPDRLTVAVRDRMRSEYETARAARHAMLALQAPWPYRLLALLPNPKKPLETWIAAEKTKLQNRS